MAQSSLECANIALTKIGAAKITSLSDATETAITANLCIDPVKKNLLRLHPWNFAVKRDKLEATITDVTTATHIGSGSWRITAVAHGYAVGDWVQTSGIVLDPSGDINGTYEVTVVNSDDIFTIVEEDVTSGSYSSGGTTWLSNPFEFTYKLALPSDCLRVLRVNDAECGVDWRIEGRFILSQDSELEIKYVQDVTDYTLMDSAFYDLLSTALALEIAYKISQSSTLLEQLAEMYRRQMGKVRHVDATEDPAETLGADDWINSRFNHSSGWPMRLS